MGYKEAEAGPCGRRDGFLIVLSRGVGVAENRSAESPEYGSETAGRIFIMSVARGGVRHISGC